MRRYVLKELRRAVVSVPFAVGLAAATAAGLTGMLPELRFANTAGALYLFRAFYSSALALLAPVIATVPFAQTYAAERNSGFSRSVFVRMASRRYAAIKLAVSAFTGGLVLALPVAGVALWVTGAYPMVADPNGPPTLFARTLPLAPVAFIWSQVAIAFAFGATFATVGLACSCVFRSPYFASVTPLALYLVPAFLFGSIGLGFLDPPMMWEPSNHIATSPLTVGAQYLVVLGTAAFVFFRFLRLKEE
ncbi:MAG: hypothetical protein Q7W30_05010 [Coriobacteriia bacterium]|nr:hypothetical protein [Coriobacteriia bacterium]